ncbi:hypothetical protein Phum_PHUM554720 [Pediculus humanus corporis]|uniref:Uncharacterized protein n=1 Tax=Pediculus humanus subsp. corporis TaxID=121224 RepID=E0W0H8_PEDHC|nr:uncharacterized protein Phum_PHUM554720 [Pediculus humanus corporis]EEB19134.1 hypothetical protein Phum_PHUM554720 [Pediculus humanus corporis]
MEDTVRTMLQYKSRCELLNQEKVFLTAAYELVENIKNENPTNYATLEPDNTSGC